MKILITGASGLLGSCLVEKLSEDHQIFGVDRCSTSLSVPSSHLCRDLTQPQAIVEALHLYQPNLVIHAAAMTHVDQCELEPQKAALLNETMTYHIADACQKARVFLAFFSTDYVFDGNKQGEYDEEDALNPQSVYGQTKANAENYLRKNIQDFVIFRLSWLYGLRGASFPRTILNKAADGQKKFQIVADQIGRPTYVQDLAGAFKEIFHTGEKCHKILGRETFHLTNTGETSWADFAAYFLNKAGYAEASVEKISSEQLQRPALRPKNSRLSLTKVEKLLGIRLRSWQAACDEFLREYTHAKV